MIHNDTCIYFTYFFSLDINPTFVSLVNPEVQRKQRQAAQLSASLPASLPVAAPPVSITTSVLSTTPALSSASENTDDPVISIDAEPVDPSVDVVTESQVETTVMTQDTTSAPSADTGYKHEPTLLERMSLAESSSLTATGTVAAEADGVAVTSRQRKSKGRKKKRRPKDTLGEEGKHSRRGSEQQHIPTKDKEEDEASITMANHTQYTTIEQHDTSTHSNINQETPEISTVGEDIVNNPVAATDSIDTDEPVQSQAVEEQVVKEQPQLDNANPFDSNGINEERTIGLVSSDSNQLEEPLPLRTPFITDEPDNEEITDDFRDLEAAGAMAVAARRGARQRGRSDAISSPVRSSHDYCMVDDSSPGEIERASDSPLVTGELIE